MPRSYQVMPPLSDADYSALKADIAERGIMVPVEVDEVGAVLDGHHRVKVCDELGIHCPRFVREGMDEAAKRTHALALNLCRRQLNRQERESIWAELRKAGKSYREIAEADGTASAPTIMRSVSGVSNETTRGRDGKTYKARKPIRYTLIDETPQGVSALKERVKEVRAAEQAIKRAARDARLVSLSNSNAPLPQDRLYPVIYADPPWEYDFSPSSGRAVENHYPTMPIEEIWALPVEGLATEDAMLFLWAPPSFIKKGIATLEAWGFDLASSAVWVKDRIGTGIYFRQRHEYLLLGKRGKPITPAPGTQPESIIEGVKGEHSAKPTRGYEIIEQMYPGLPKIELFSRSPREGWAAWGNQADE